MVAYERALLWRELFELAILANTNKSPEEIEDENSDISTLAYRIAGDTHFVSLIINSESYKSEELSSKKRHNEAAQVLLDYAQDVRSCVSALTHGNHFSEARRIVSAIVCKFLDGVCLIHERSLQIALQRAPELIEEILHPACLDSRTQLGEEIEEMRNQLTKQMNRLRELAERKVAEPGM